MVRIWPASWMRRGLQVLHAARIANPHTHPSVLNTALSLEPASKILSCAASGNKASMGQEGEYTWTCNSPWRSGSQWGRADSAQPESLPRKLLHCCDFSPRTPELGAVTVGEELIMASFLLCSCWLCWIRTGWDGWGRSRASERVTTSCMAPDPGSCHLPLQA